MAAIRLFRTGGMRRYVGLLRFDNGVLRVEVNRKNERDQILRIFKETPELLEPQLTSQTSDGGWGTVRLDSDTFPWLHEAAHQFLVPQGYTFDVEG